jgi:hypothetical protein
LKGNDTQQFIAGDLISVLFFVAVAAAAASVIVRSPQAEIMLNALMSLSN